MLARSPGRARSCARLAVLRHATAATRGRACRTRCSRARVHARAGTACRRGQDRAAVDVRGGRVLRRASAVLGCARSVSKETYV